MPMDIQVGLRLFCKGTEQRIEAVSDITKGRPEELVVNIGLKTVDNAVVWLEGEGVPQGYTSEMTDRWLAVAQDDPTVTVNVACPVRY